MEIKPYTLADYYKQSGIFIPDFAKHIQINPTRIPAEHQISGLKRMTEFERFLLLDDPGTGKTIIAQAYAMWLVGQRNFGVVVMPPVLLDQFLASFEYVFPGYGRFIRCEILAGTIDKQNKLISKWNEGSWPHLVVVSHKLFVKYYQSFLQRGYNFGIFDEATIIWIKTTTSQMHKAVKIFGGNFRRDSNGIVLMTGTPVETHVHDAYGLIAITNPDQYGSKIMFEKVHCVFAPVSHVDKNGKEHENMKIVGYKNLDVLHHSLMKRGRRVKKSDVSKDLPPRMVQEIPLRLHPAHQALYQTMTNDRIIEVGDRVLDFTDSSKLYQGMQRILLTPEKYTDRKIDNVVVEAIQTLVDSLGGRKVIVYAWYKDSIEALKNHFAHLNPAVMNSTTSSRRTAEKMKFINDPTCLMVIANPRSGGVGIDGWQDVCSAVIFAEVCPFIGTFQQAISRLHRRGQTGEAINIWILVVLGTIAVKLRNDLIKSDREQEGAVQDGRKILADLRGDRGLIGSLDDFDFDAEIEDEKELVDIDQE